MAKRTGLRAVLTDPEIVVLALEAATNDPLTLAQAALADRAWEKMRQTDYRAEKRLALVVRRPGALVKGALAALPA